MFAQARRSQGLGRIDGDIAEARRSSLQMRERTDSESGASQEMSSPAGRRPTGQPQPPDAQPRTARIPTEYTSAPFSVEQGTSCWCPAYLRGVQTAARAVWRGIPCDHESSRRASWISPFTRTVGDKELVADSSPVARRTRVRRRPALVAAAKRVDRQRARAAPRAVAYLPTERREEIDSCIVSNTARARGRSAETLRLRSPSRSRCSAGLVSSTRATRV